MLSPRAGEGVSQKENKSEGGGGLNGCITLIAKEEILGCAARKFLFFVLFFRGGEFCHFEWFLRKIGPSVVFVAHR